MAMLYYYSSEVTKGALQQKAFYHYLLEHTCITRTPKCISELIIHIGLLLIVNLGSIPSSLMPVSSSKFLQKSSQKFLEVKLRALGLHKTIHQVHIKRSVEVNVFITEFFVLTSRISNPQVADYIWPNRDFLRKWYVFLRTFRMILYSHITDNFVSLRGHLRVVSIFPEWGCPETSTATSTADPPTGRADRGPRHD